MYKDPQKARDYKHNWHKQNRKKTVHNIIDEYIRFVNTDEDVNGSSKVDMSLDVEIEDVINRD